MDFLELMQKRRSVRSFKDKEIPEEILDKILEAIRIAPSAGNIQSYKIKIIRDKETKEKLVKASFGQKFIAQAPVVIAFLAHPEEAKRHYGDRGEQLYSIQDATIALYTAHLATTKLGLGSCWIGAFDNEYVLSALNADKKRYVCVGFLPIGYPEDKVSEKKRKELKDLILE
jgi:nitroreductase